MSLEESQASMRRHRAQLRASALRREQLLKDLQTTQRQDRLRVQEADAAKTARLRALRLVKEATDAAALRLKDAGVQS